MFKKVVFAFIAVVFIFLMGLGIGFVAHRFLPYLAGRSYDSVVILTRVQNLKELVTVKYVLEKVEVYDDPKWYGDNRVLLVAHGVVKAGIDLDSLKPADIDVSGKRISIRLPAPRITDVYLDDHHSQIVERTTGLLRTFDKDLETDARIVAVEDLRKAAVQNGILADAAERARVDLKDLFFGLGFTDVEFCGK